MKARILAVLAISILLLATAAFADDTAALYKSKCAGCHAADGTGSAIGQKLGAKSFASADVQKQSDADLVKTITNGKGKMPAFNGKLTAPQINSLVTYIRTFAKK